MTNVNCLMNFAYHIEELLIINCKYIGHMSQMLLNCKEKTNADFNGFFFKFVNKRTVTVTVK